MVNKTKKEDYNNLNPNIFKDNKKFWNAIRPFISDKQKNFQKDFILVDNGIVTSTEVAENMNNFFIDVIENLDIEHFAEESTNEMNPNVSIENIVNMYSKHPSILKIKKHVTIVDAFSFRNITSLEHKNGIKALVTQNATVKHDIPTKMLTETNDISCVSYQNL